MKIELHNNKVYFNNGTEKKEIHPFWLRERVDGDEFVDKGTQQRLFDPTSLSNDIIINKASIHEEFLEVNFNDGISSKLNLNKIALEFSKEDTIIKSIEKTKWDSSLSNIKNFEYQDNFYESKEMHDLLVSFYKFGFVVIKNIPTTKNYIVEFANSIGSVRRTNFGEYFDVKSKPDPNDLAYTSLALAPHTDNPYRNPVPCIQLLHCIENKVSGGYSTLVDGYTVTEDLKKSYPDYYKILTEVKVRFKFIDKEVIYRDLDDEMLFVSGLTESGMKIDEKDQTEEHKKMFELSNKLVKELKESDIIIISAPIYNYGPPATLKAWSDLAARIGETFKFKPNGRREGLLKNKKAYLVITSGGTKLNSSEDFLTPWLKFILNFFGIEKVEVISADQMALDYEKSIRDAEAQIENISTD